MNKRKKIMNNLLKYLEDDKYRLEEYQKFVDFINVNPELLITRKFMDSINQFLAS